jgi:hypothetical protein
MGANLTVLANIKNLALKQTFMYTTDTNQGVQDFSLLTDIVEKLYGSLQCL